jgi:hypothetical protein
MFLNFNGKRRFIPLFDAEGGNGGGGGATPPADPKPEGGTPQGGEDPTPGEGGKTFTQAELDAIIAKRLARERKQWEQQLEEQRKKEQMSAEERLKAEKEEAEKKAQQIQQTANQRLIQAEAKVIAAELGVKPNRINYLLKLADLSGVEVGEDGGIDSNAIKDALNTVLADFPELKGAGGGSVGGAGNPGGGNNNPTDFRKASQEEFAAELAKYGLRPF